MAKELSLIQPADAPIPCEISGLEVDCEGTVTPQLFASPAPDFRRCPREHSTGALLDPLLMAFGFPGARLAKWIFWKTFSFIAHFCAVMLPVPIMRTVPMAIEAYPSVKSMALLISISNDGLSGWRRVEQGAALLLHA